MNLIIITQRDPLFIDTFLKEINYSAFEKAFIYDVPNFGSGKLSAIKKFVQLFGWYQTFKAVYLSLTVKKIKLANVFFKKIEFDRALSEIKSLEVSEQDILLSVSAPKKIDIETLSLFKFRFNFHCGKLPEYAGMMPMYWQMFNREKEFTITMHELANEIDQGDILYEAAFPFSGNLFNDMVKSKFLSAEIFNNFVSKNLILKRKKVLGSVKLRKYPDKFSITEFRQFNND